MLHPFSYWARLRARLRRILVHDQSHPDDSVRLFFVAEGTNDIAFLRRISAILHADDPLLPDLGSLEHVGKLVFVAFGGGEIWPWTHCLAGLGRPEFHLYDREVSPVTESRRTHEICRARAPATKEMPRMRHIELMATA